jgi:hypothetical protein
LLRLFPRLRQIRTTLPTTQEILCRAPQSRHSTRDAARYVRYGRSLDLACGDNLLAREWELVGAWDGLGDNVGWGDAGGEEGGACGGDEGGDERGVPAGVDDCYAEVGACWGNELLQRGRRDRKRVTDRRASVRRLDLFERPWLECTA